MISGNIRVDYVTTPAGQFWFDAIFRDGVKGGVIILSFPT